MSLKIVCALELLAFIAVAATVFMVLPYLPRHIRAGFLDVLRCGRRAR